MASYNHEERRLIVEIGITSHRREDCDRYLEHMCRSFTTQWRSGAELRVGSHSFEHAWLQIEAGLVLDFPTRCRAFALPELSKGWTSYLVQRSDLILFLCRATIADIDAAVASMDRVRRLAAEAGVPIVVVWLDVDPGKVHLVTAGPESEAPMVAVPRSSNNPEGHRLALRAALHHAIGQLPNAVLEEVGRAFGQIDP